jgi:signal transduction histidine kinase
MKFQLKRLPHLCVALSCLTSLLPDSLAAAPAGLTSNPIGRVARLFNRTLVRDEDQIIWLRSRLVDLAVFAEIPLNEQVGWRCGLIDPEAGRPWLALDLGREFPLDQIFLIPAQRQAGDPLDLFPRRFTIIAANQPDFSDARTIHRTTSRPQLSPAGYPVRINGDELPARHIRITFDEGHACGLKGVCALSEIFVFSDQHPVSLGAEVTTGQSVNIPGVWEPSFVVDGRTPLGLWEGGIATLTESRGHCLEVPADRQDVEWIIDLGKQTQIDHLILFPYALPELSGPGVMPPSLKVEIASNPDFDDSVRIASNGVRDIPIDLTTPVILSAEPVEGRYLRILSDRAWQLGNRHLQSLGEVEAWSGNVNLAAGQPVTVRHAGLDLPIQELTDGFGSGKQIIPIFSWLNQLVERATLEKEVDNLTASAGKMAAESELNTTWGAAIALGLTFLIPVAIVERRRLISRTHLDKLRKRIASDLHDDIGSNLGSISLIARSAKRDLERLHGPEGIASDLGEMETIARESSLAMRDIVWLLERRQDTIGDLIQRMRDCAARLLREIEYSLVCRSSKTAAKLTLDAKRHLFLFYKEALHNIVKHSRATNVTVKLYDSKDKLVLEVSDNGIGLPRGEGEEMAAVKKLSDRARVLEGSLEVESTPGKGTTLRLSVKRINLMATKKTSHE